MTTPMIVSRSGHDDLTINPGETFIWPGDEIAAFSYGEDCVTANLTVPHEIATAFQSSFMTRVTPNETRGLNLLQRYAELVLGEANSSPRLDALAGQHLADLAIFVLGSDGDECVHAGRNGVRAARLARIKADIAANLGNPDLSLDWLARRHDLRPRAIQDLFYATGEGYTEFVRAQRLDHALQLLTDPGRLERNIAEIALASGFGDISWFNNAFRRRFGMTPSEARILATTGRESDEL